MSLNLDFYDINTDYIDYLKRFDAKVPDIVYQERHKFLCGVLFKEKGLNYFAPVSSSTVPQKTSYIIKVGDVPVGSIRFSFMFPVPDSEIKVKNIRSEENYQYRFLLNQELRYCNQHYGAIKGKAEDVYRGVIANNTFYRTRCCNFKKLETKCKQWIYQKVMDKRKQGVPIWQYTFQEKMTLLEYTGDRELISLLKNDTNSIIQERARLSEQKLDEKTSNKSRRIIIYDAKKDDVVPPASTSVSTLTELYYRLFEMQGIKTNFSIHEMSPKQFYIQAGSNKIYAVSNVNDVKAHMETVKQYIQDMKTEKQVQKYPLSEKLKAEGYDIKLAFRSIQKEQTVAVMIMKNDMVVISSDAKQTLTEDELVEVIDQETKQNISHYQQHNNQNTPASSHTMTKLFLNESLQKDIQDFLPEEIKNENIEKEVEELEK